MPNKGRGGENREFSKFGTNDDDTLDGSGGSYRLAGGRGNDIYLVDDADDVIDEKNNQGIDSVVSSVDYVLDDNVEELILAGSDDLNGIGNDDDNLLVGNSGNNILEGGFGNDVVDGGEGTDSAQFTGSAADYIIEVNETEVIVSNIKTFEVNRLTNIELLVFDDETIDLVAPIPTPLPPGATANSDTAATDEDTSLTINLLSNDIGESLSVISVSQGSIGSVADNGDGTITYTPAPDTFGVETLTYTIRDSHGAESTATVEIEIVPVNDAPLAQDDAYEVGDDPLLSGVYNVLENDLDIDGDALRVAAAGASAESLLGLDETSGAIAFETEAGGLVELNADGTFSYTPTEGYSGNDSFAYTAIDTYGETSTASVQLEATSIIEEPVPEDVPYYVDALLYDENYRVNAGDPLGSETIVTYAFAGSTPSYYEPDSRMHVNFQTFSDPQREATVGILNEIDSMTNLTFVETSVEEAEMVLGIADIGSSGLAYLPGQDGVGNTRSDVWLDDGFAGSDFAEGTTAYKTLMHEIGHGLGMVHPVLPDGEETRQFTVMAGNRHETMGSEEPSSYMLYDVAALQHYYGVDSTTTGGDDVYRFEDLDGSVKTIWDGGGHDTIDMSASTYGVNIDLNQGAFSTVDEAGTNNVAIAYGAEVEDVLGGVHDDRLTGNDLDNWIVAGGGNDELTGGLGSDTYGFSSGWGNDVITDFNAKEDQINLSELQISIEDLFISSDESNVYLEYEQNSITLNGVQEEDLDEDWLDL